MRFEFVEGITLADTAVRSYGKTLPELFESSALGLLNLMAGDQIKTGRDKKFEIELENSDIEMLLYDFLNEFLFYRDARSLLIFPETIEIKEIENRFVLTVLMSAEKIDPARHKMDTEVKAVTLHRFSVKGKPGAYESLVVYDL